MYLSNLDYIYSFYLEQNLIVDFSCPKVEIISAQIELEYKWYPGGL